MKRWYNTFRVCEDVQKFLQTECSSRSKYAETYLKNRKDGAIMNIKVEELLAALRKKEEEKEKNTVLWVLAVIGAVAAVAGIAFAVYRFFTPDYLEDFEEDFDDDFDDYFEDEED